MGLNEHDKLNDNGQTDLESSDRASKALARIIVLSRTDVKLTAQARIKKLNAEVSPAADD